MSKILAKVSKISNIRLIQIRYIFESVRLFMPIWYIFQTQFISPKDLSFLIAIVGFFSFFLDLPTGIFADIFSRRKSIFLGFSFLAISIFCLIKADNSIWIIFSYIFSGIGTAFISGADEAFIYDSLKQEGLENEFAHINSKLALTYRIGLVVSIFLGGFVYSINNRLPYIISFFATLVVLLITLCLKEPKIDSQKYSFSSYLLKMKEGIKQLFKTQKVIWFSIYYILIGGITNYFSSFLHLSFYSRIGLTTIQQSFIMSAFFLINGVLLFFLTKVSYLNFKRVIYIFPVLMILGFFPAFFHNVFLGVLVSFFATLAAMGRFTFLNQYANKEFDSQCRATAFSSLNMFIKILVLLISLSTAKILSSYGAEYVMTFLGIVSLLFVLPLAFLINNQK